MKRNEKVKRLTILERCKQAIKYKANEETYNHTKSHIQSKYLKINNKINTICACDLNFLLKISNKTIDKQNSLFFYSQPMSVFGI